MRAPPLRPQWAWPRGRQPGHIALPALTLSVLPEALSRALLSAGGLQGLPGPLRAWPLTGCFSGVLGPCPAFRCERPELMTRLLSPEERRGHGSEQTVACWFKVWISHWTWRSTRPTVGFCPHYRALVNGAMASPEQCVFGEHSWWHRSHVRSARWSQRGPVARCPGDSPKPRTRSAASTPRSARCSRPLVPSPRGRCPRSDHGEAGARPGGRDRPPCGEADGESCSLRVP